MELTYQIKAIETKSLPGYDDVVMRVHYTIDAITEEYAKHICNKVNLDTSELSNFVQFDDLQEATVIDWVRNALGGDDKVAARIQSDFNKASQKPQRNNLPWAAGDSQ